MSARAVLVVVGLWVVSGCASDDRSSSRESLADGSTSATAASEASSLSEEPEAIDALVADATLVEAWVARGVAADGSPVDPALTFAADAPEIAFVAALGDVGRPATLAVAWTWRDAPEGARALFTHEIDGVGPADLAWSTGVASGPLAAGRYTITVTVNDDAVAEREFVVDPGVPDVPTLDEPAALRQDAQPAPPSSGQSGASSTAAPADGSTSCQPFTSVSPSQFVTTGANGCVADDEFEVTASVGNGGPRRLHRAFGDFVKPVRADPCQLGGSDLALDPITYRTRAIAGPHAGAEHSKATRPTEDETAPLAVLGGTPVSGTHVLGLEEVVLDARAIESGVDEEIMTGIASVVVTVAGGPELLREQFDGPTPCDRSRLEKQYELRYTIPADAPEIVTISLKVRDFAGHETTAEVHYVTVTTWRGYMDVTQKTSAMGGTLVCSSRWQIRVELLILADGVANGYGDAQPTDAWFCDDPSYPAPTPVHLKLIGVLTDIQLVLTASVGESGLSYPGFQVLILPPAPDIVLPRDGETAAGEVSFSRNAGPGVTDEVIGTVYVAADRG